MATYSNKKIKVKAVPGTCIPKIISTFSPNVKLDSSDAMIGMVAVNCSGGTWGELVNCNGSGMIKGTGSKVKINGMNTVLKTDSGECNGMGLTPKGEPMPCKCKLIIQSSGSKIKQGASAINNSHSENKNESDSKNKENSSDKEGKGNENFNAQVESDLKQESQVSPLGASTLTEEDKVSPLTSNEETLACIKDFKLQVEKWQKANPKLLSYLKDKLNPDYILSNSIVYNNNLNSITKESKVKYIFIADNPGKDEQEKEIYLTGQSGKLARSFMLKNSLVDDFDEEIIVLNKTPIHTKSTKQLEDLEEYNELIKESQVYMANLCYKLQQIFNCQVWVIGISSLTTLFKPFTKSLHNLFIREEAWKQIYFYNHFSFNSFARQLKTAIEGETVSEKLEFIGINNKKRIIKE